MYQHHDRVGGRTNVSREESYKLAEDGSGVFRGSSEHELPRILQCIRETGGAGIRMENRDYGAGIRHRAMQGYRSSVSSLRGRRAIDGRERAIRHGKQRQDEDTQNRCDGKIRLSPAEIELSRHVKTV